MSATASLLVWMLAGLWTTFNAAAERPREERSAVAAVIRQPATFSASRPINARPDDDEPLYELWFGLNVRAAYGVSIDCEIAERDVTKGEGAAHYIGCLEVRYYFLPFTSRGLGGKGTYRSPLRIWLPTRGTGSVLQVSIAPAFWRMLAEEFNDVANQGD